MDKVVSIENMRKAKDDYEFFDKIHDQIVAKCNDYLLVLEGDEGISYSHSDGEIELIAKFIKSKEQCGNITSKEYLDKLTVILAKG